MSWLKNIFKKKPGGTFFGNLLRSGASAASGGILGQGANRIELGQTKTNAELATEAGLPPENVGAQVLASVVGVAAATPQGTALATNAGLEWVKSKLVWIVMGVGLIFIYLKSGKKTKSFKF